MGIMNFIRGQLIEIIEWTDDSRDTISFRFRTTTPRSSAARN